MTTEVYRNMIFAEQFKEHNPILDNLKTVIFDELQYLGDVDRGGIWEQSIMFTPSNVQLLSLSATIGNNEEINNAYKAAVSTVDKVASKGIIKKNAANNKKAAEKPIDNTRK